MARNLKCRNPINAFGGYRYSSEILKNLNIIQSRYTIHNKIKMKTYRGKFGGLDIESTRFEESSLSKRRVFSIYNVTCLKKNKL
jgi:hypothetical protein